MNADLRSRRQKAIAELIRGGSLGSQEELTSRLAGLGFAVTQATVSRDLDDLGAIKVRVPGGESVYAIPELPSEQIAPEDHLRRVLGEWVADVVVSSNLVVIRTPPGSAHVVASAIDRAGLSEIVGTVAGDDTIIAVAAEHIGGTKAAHLLRELAGL